LKHAYIACHRERDVHATVSGTTEYVAFQSLTIAFTAPSPSDFATFAPWACAAGTTSDSALSHGKPSRRGEHGVALANDRVNRIGADSSTWPSRMTSPSVARGQYGDLCPLRVHIEHLSREQALDQQHVTGGDGSDGRRSGLEEQGRPVSADVREQRCPRRARARER
jgi:hypothetical protein